MGTASICCRTRLALFLCPEEGEGRGLILGFPKPQCPYGFFLSTLVVPPNLVLGLVPAGVLSFLGYQILKRGTRTTA